MTARPIVGAASGGVITGAEGGVGGTLGAAGTFGACGFGVWGFGVCGFPGRDGEAGACSAGFGVTAVSTGAAGRTTRRPAATTEVPPEGCTRRTAGPGRVDRRSRPGAVAPGAVGAVGVVQRLMIAGTWQWCVGDTLFGAPAGI